MTIRDDRALELLRFLVAWPNGVKFTEMKQELDAAGLLGLSMDFQTRQAISDLRESLGNTDTINLVAIPAGQQEEWTYKLVGNLADALPWVVNRLRDTETRMRTQASVYKSLLAAVKAAGLTRTKEGQRVKTIEKSTRRLVEDLEDLETIV